GEVCAADPREWIVAAFLAFLDRRPMEEAPAAASVGLVEDEVPREVLVGEDDARVVCAPRERERAVGAVRDRLHLSRREIDSERIDGGLGPRLGCEVGDAAID